MHNLKRLLLVSTLCIAMAFPSTALANEITTTEVTTPAEESISTTVVDDTIPADDTTPVDNTNTDVDQTLPEEGTDVTDDATTDTTPADDTVSDDTTTDGDGEEVGEEPAPEEPEYDGLVTIDGKKYYYKNGVKLTNKVVQVDGYRYYLTEDGSAYNTYGTLVTAADGHQYTFRTSGVAYKNCIRKIDDKYYYFGEYSFMVNKPGRVVRVNEEYYTFNSDGSLFTGGLKKVGDYYYFFQKNAKALKSSLKAIRGNKYFFMGNGRACTSWRTVDSKIYCFGSNGKALSGFRYRTSNKTWYYMDPIKKYSTFKGNPLYRAYKKIKSASSSSNYIICVDSTACRCSIFIRQDGKWVPYKYWKCSPGKTSTPTVTGWFKVGARGYSFGGSTYTCYYYTQFYGDYLFHSVLYHKGTFNIKKGTLGHRLSHGCVRLDINNAKWIYDNIPSGTSVCSYL